MEEYGRRWIQEKSLDVLEEYEGQITLRQLYYRLVAVGFPNDLNHYKRVIGAMTDSRWSGAVKFTAFIDRERSMVGETQAEVKSYDEEVERAKAQIRAWMEHYSLNRWENQPEYIEVWIEKKALQGVFEGVCWNNRVGLAPCKGYPSLTFLAEAYDRFDKFSKSDKDVTILYFGDYDPSGEDIPRSISENLSRMGCDVNVERIALTPEQIRHYKLPSVPAKVTDSRSRSWSGSGVVELDAVEPKTLDKLCKEAILTHFDRGLHTELKAKEEEEQGRYREELVEFVKELGGA